MAELQDTDLFLVNRNDTSAKIASSELMAELLDDDYMLVNRTINGVPLTYKILGSDVMDSLSDIIKPGIDNILIDGQPPTEAGTVDDPIILTPITVAKSGQLGETVEEITVQGQKEGKYVIFIDNSVGAGDRFVQLVHQIDAAGQWTGHLEYADTPPTQDETVYQGLLQLGEVHFSWQVTQLASIAPVIDSVTLSEDDPTGKRFTSESFTTTAVMVEDGLPPSTKGIRGWVEGTLGGQPISDEITAVSTITAPIYSNNVTLSSGGWLRTPDNAFDGDTSTDAASDADESFTISFNPVITGVTKLEVGWPQTLLVLGAYLELE